MTEIDHEYRRALNRRLLRKEAQLDWARKIDLPSPAYHPQNGWKLDEFAMNCDPEGLREYKDALFHSWRGPLKPEAESLLSEFPRAIHRHLLVPQFETKGVRPDGFEYEVISVVLLENMLPFLGTSELLDVTQGIDPQRRYEHVRVFRASPHAKPRGGKKPSYNWPKLVKKLEQEGLTFESRAKLIEFCRANVCLLPGKQGAEGGPDDNTIRPAISKYGLEKLIRSGED